MQEAIADYIASNYTFVDSTGREYTDDGFNKANEFMYMVIFPMVDEFLKDQYKIAEEEN